MLQQAKTTYKTKAPPPVQADIEDDDHLGLQPETIARKEKAAELEVNVVRKIVDRIERLEAEKAAQTKASNSDIADIYLEAKGKGLNPKALRALIRERKQEAAALEELQSDLDIYRDAMG